MESKKLKKFLEDIENKNNRTKEELRDYFLNCQKNHIIISGQSAHVISKIPDFPLKDFKEWVFKEKFTISGGLVFEYITKYIK